MTTTNMNESRAATSNTSRRVAGAAGIMMLSILASRLLGLVRDAVISGKFGQGETSDVYFAAFQVPDILFFLIAGGALSSAFIPVFTEYLTKGRDEEAWHIFSTVACVMFMVVSGFVLLCEAFTPQLVLLTGYGYSAEKRDMIVPLTRIVLPAQLCFFLGGLMMGVQNARQQFRIAALGPVIYNLGIIIGGLALTGSFGVAGLCWGALIGALVGNFLLQVWAVRRLGARFKLSFDCSHPGVKKVWLLMLPVVFGLALPQVSLQFNKIFATTLGDGPLSAINRANMVMQIPLGIFAQAMGIAIFPTLSALAAEKKTAELRSTINQGIRTLMMLTIPTSIFMIVLSVPIIQLLFQHGKFTLLNTHMTASAFAYYAIGIFAWSAQAVLARGFYALQDTKTPVIIGTVVTFVFIPMNLLLRGPLGYQGLALATTIAAVLHMFSMLYVLRNRLQGIEGGKLVQSTGKILFASVIGAIACWSVQLLVQHVIGPTPVGPHVGKAVKVHALLLCALGFSGGVAAFVMVARALRVSELQFAARMLRRRTA